MLGYTGTFNGAPVSVQTSGMGTPSLSIVVEELLRLGAKRLIRVGTCGGIGPGLKTGDLVIATAACPVDGATRTYLHGEPYAPAADFALTRALVESAERQGIPVQGRAGGVRRRLLQPRRRTTRSGGATVACWHSRWRRRPSSTSPLGAGVQAACVLVVSDVLSEVETSEETYLSPDELVTAAVGPDAWSLALGAAGGIGPAGRRTPAMTDTRQPRRREPGRRPINKNADDEAQDFLPAEGHRPHRVLGGQRQAGRRTTTARCGASPRSPTRASRRGCAIGPAT